ncbi:MAG: flagellar motor switch protein FliM [Chloroflexi bacterium]|nr:flagellar motor switch protein FliM [Chloroflexota bacterium]
MESKILSQYEIDSLLSSLTTETPAEEESMLRRPQLANVKAYDFRRPDKFSKDHIRTLQMIHESFSRLIASSLSGYLRLGITTRLVSVEQLVYDEYLARIPAPTLLNIVSLSPLPGRSFLEISLPVAFAFLDRLLGGTAKSLQKTREPTDIELSLLNSITALLLNNLKEAWGNVIHLDPALEETSLSPQQIHGLLPTDVMVVFAFEARIMEAGGTMSLAMPYALLEPVLPKLSAQLWFTSSRQDGSGEAPSGLRRQVEKVAIPVQVQLGRAKVTLRELIDLQGGDVITLDTYLKDDVPVLVRGESKYRGRPGLVGKRMSVQITEVLEDTEEETVERRA